MDEILASIRRIIAEDETPASDPPLKSELRAVETPEPEVEQAADDVPDPDPEASAPEQDADLSVAEETPLDDFDDVPVGEAEAMAEEAVPEPEPEATPEQPAAAAALSAAREALAELRDREPDPVVDEAPDVEEAGSDVAAAAFDDAPETGHVSALDEEPETMISTVSASAAADAFGALEENIRIAQGEGQTLEGLVEKMLEPMLKAWLDENLPRIVEEKVEEEVRRISRRR